MICGKPERADDKGQQSIRTSGTNMIFTTVRTTSLLLLSVCLAIPCGLAAQATSTTSHLRGTVFLGAHNKAYGVEGATVTLYGDAGVVSTITDRDGKYVFSNVQPPGFYFLEATYSGLHAGQNVEVNAGDLIEVSLRLEAPDPSAFNVSAKP